MMQSYRFPCFFAATTSLVLMACGPDNTPPTTTGDSSSGSSGSSSSSSGGDPMGLCGGTGEAPTIYEALPTIPACAAPTGTETHVIDNGFYGSVGIASCGGILGMAYFKGQSNILFQALDTSGAPIDQPLSVFNIANTAPILTTIASNRKTFMVCASDANGPVFQCAVVDPDQRSVTVGTSMGGSQVQITWGVGGYVAVFKDPDTKVAKAQRIGDDASFVGSPVDLGITTKGGGIDVAPLASTYAFVADGGFVMLDGMTLMPTETPTTTDFLNTFGVRVAATPKATALIHHGGGSVQESVVPAGMTMLSTPVSLSSIVEVPSIPDVIAAEGSFAAVWGGDTGLQYRAFDEAGTPAGTEQVTLGFGPGFYIGMGLVAVKDGFVVAGGGQSSVSVGKITCP